LPFKNKEIWKILEKYKEEMNVFSARRRCHSSTRKYGRFWKRRLHKIFMKGTDRI
jgi:hypothetical protein